MMLRLFIAIPLPTAIKEEIVGLGGLLAGARPVPVEQLHLTLKFIGEVEGSRRLDIEEVLAEISRPSFSLCLQGVGTFPPRGVPRVLWAGVQPKDDLLSLRRSIENKLAEIGIPRERQKFQPHLTLARLNNPSIHHLQQFLAGNALLRSPEFSVASFCLYKSQLTNGGPLHSRLQTYALQVPVSEGDKGPTNDRQPPFLRQ